MGAAYVCLAALHVPGFVKSQNPLLVLATDSSTCTLSIVSSWTLVLLWVTISGDSSMMAGSHRSINCCPENLWCSAMPWTAFSLFSTANVCSLVNMAFVASNFCIPFFFTLTRFFDVYLFRLPKSPHLFIYYYCTFTCHERRVPSRGFAQREVGNLEIFPSHASSCENPLLFESPEGFSTTNVQCNGRCVCRWAPPCLEVAMCRPCT